MRAGAASPPPSRKELQHVLCMQSGYPRRSCSTLCKARQPGAPLQDLGGLWPLTLRHPTYAYSTLRCLEWLACTGRNPHCTRCRLFRCAASVREISCRQPSRGVGPPTVSRHEVSTVQVCCLRPVFPPVTHRVGFGPPTVSRHEVSTVQVCAPGRRLHRYRGRSCRSRSLHVERIPKTHLLDAM